METTKFQHKLHRSSEFAVGSDIYFTGFMISLASGHPLCGIVFGILGGVHSFASKHVENDVIVTQNQIEELEKAILLAKQEEFLQKIEEANYAPKSGLITLSKLNK